MRTHGSNGPSGLRANEWRQILSAFDMESVDVCKAISNLDVKIATENLDGLDVYNVCRLIALNNPGVRPGQLELAKFYGESSARQSLDVFL